MTGRRSVPLRFRPWLEAHVHRNLSPGKTFHTTPPASATQEVAADRITTESPEKQHATESSIKPKSRPFSRSLLYAVVSLLVGFSLGKVVVAIVIPPPSPLPDSPDDEFFLSKLRKDVSDLPLVKELRSQREEWLEYEAYTSQSPEAKATSLLAEVMHGSRGLGIQRMFWNKKERRLISIVYLGGALAGWPGVVHGGAIATVIQESLETAVNGPGIGQTSIKSFGLAGVKLRYRKPANANRLYVIRAEVEEGSVDKADDDTKVGVKTTLENALTGAVCAEADGHCMSNRWVSLGDQSRRETTSLLWETCRSAVRGILG